MKYHEPLKQILSKTRSYWDREETRPAVRQAFDGALQCRTATLGGEVYASEDEERIFFHPCKSRSCSSCGYRATVRWQRERWAALPDTPYQGITLTMPDVLWTLFRDNPRLARALPSLAATVIQAHVIGRHGVHVGIIAILHTFNGKLEFNSHVHTIVTSGGLHGSSGVWIPHVYYDRDGLTKAWRRAVIALLRAAGRANQLRVKVPPEQTERLLTEQENRWWSINIQSLKSKERFLRYAARYARRPPIAQRRITKIAERTVTFWAKDKKQRRRVDIECSLEEFIDRWAQHIPERYRHAVRSFGLFAPRAIRETGAAMFALLGQERGPRPKARRWADSLKRDFGRDPLVSSSGKPMKWVRRLPTSRGKGLPVGGTSVIR